jgi:hypothetical protein
MLDSCSTSKFALAIPQKRSEKGQVSFLEPDEVEATLAAPDTTVGKGGGTDVVLATFDRNQRELLDERREPLSGRLEGEDPVLSSAHKKHWNCAEALL